MDFPSIKRVCVTLDNISELSSEIIAALQAPLTGLDIETEDSGRHAGLAPYNGKGKKLVFDTRRTTLCGLSLWPDGHDTAWYFNLGHADVATRIPWPVIKAILDSKPTTSSWVIHNANFERTMLASCQGWDITNYICTLVMAVSAYGPDEYNQSVFASRDLGGIAKLIPAIRAAMPFGQETDEGREILNKVIAKESDAEWSYNGYVADMSYGYGLKKAVSSWFDYQMKTFEQTLAGRAHMGELTSIETAEYGCDDAIWCVRLYHRLLQFMMDTNPSVVMTYFQQELPCVEAYSECWREGVKINAGAIAAKQDENRLTYADTTRKLKGLIKGLLPFGDEMHESLAKHDSKYFDASTGKGYGVKYRQEIERWADSANTADPFKQASQLSGSIVNGWAVDLGVTIPKGMNLSFWMCMRTLMYDLCGREKVIMEHGKVQSDAYARGRIKEDFVKEGKTAAADVMTMVGELSTIEQVAKLYLTPYMALVDPETERLYPVLGSELATRRMAMSTPNAQQLAKRGESVYVRGFYEADSPDHVIVSIDWSQIELVLIGEASGDPYFAECYGQTPYKDLHIIAAADCLGVGLDEFLALKKGDKNVSPHLLINPKGEAMEPEKAFKYWRTEVGKGANFSYFYSGALAQVGTRLGWTSEEMFEASDRYRAKFSVAEAWRIKTIQDAQRDGYVILPDGHTRTRFECTPLWAHQMRQKFARYDHPAVTWLGDQTIRRVQSRANNQVINAMIQGTCATLAKRSITKIRDQGWSKKDARFMYPIHDELVFSVNRNLVPQFITMAKGIMNNHPDIISNLKMDCSASIGLTFAPYDEKKATFGQLELSEIPALPFVAANDVGGPLPEEQWSKAVDYLFATREAA